MHSSRPRRLGFRAALALCGALIAAPVTAQDQPYQIRGTVVNAGTGEPVAGVQITIRNTGLGTLTGTQGGFQLEAPVDAGTYVLEASYLGYATLTRRLELRAQRLINLGELPMEESVVVLEQLVVTGTGSAVERRELGNVISTVPGAEISESPGATTVDQALQGKVTGAVISENSGQPGGGVSIRLRGTSSIFGGAEPLIVVDGVIMDNSSEALVGLGSNAPEQGSAITNRLADISPEDVERIEVIKGAAAAALYGSRANNGVIQIFTKRGQQGETRISAGSEIWWSETPEKYDLNFGPLATLGDVLFGGAEAVGEPVERFDLQSELWQTGFGTSHHASISGGSGGTTYYVSGAFRNEDGIVRQTGYQRINARAKISQLIGDNITVSANAAVSDSDADFVPEGEQTQGLLTSVIFTPTSFDYRFDPELGRYPYNPVLGLNPLTALEEFEATEDVLHFMGSAQAQWRPFDRFELSYLFGLDDYRQENLYLRPPFTESASFDGIVQNPVRLSRQINHDLTAEYDWLVNENFTLNTTAGTRYTSDESDAIRAAATVLTPGQTLVGAGGGTPLAASSVEEFRTFGVFLQERLNFGERLYLTGAVNYEASSAFGEDERWQLFPKLSGSYMVTDEPALQGSRLTDIFSTLRLRAAYGQTGGQPPEVYSRFDNYLGFSYAGLPALAPSDVAGNPDLKPERQTEIEGGLDFGLFDGRVQLELTAYDQVTEDLVLTVPLPPSTARQFQFQNIGEVSNRGFEAALETVNMQGETIEWRSRLQFATNKNRVNELVTDADTLIFARYLNAVVEGQAPGVFYGGTYARDANGNILYNADGLPLRGRDTLSDGSIVFDQQIIGDPNPDFTAALLNTVDIGDNMTVSVLLDGRFGNDVANFTRRIAELFGAAAVTAREATGDTVPGTFILSPTGRAGIYEEYIEDGSFVKLRELSLSYRFEDPWVQRYVGAQTLTVRAAGRNLYTWTDYSGLDPEVNLFSANTVARGVDFATTPVPRSFVLSFNVIF